MTSVRLLNVVTKSQGLECLAGEVGNVYLNARTKEKIFTKCSLECRPMMVNWIAIVQKDGLKSSGTFCQDYQPYGIYTFMVWSRDLSWDFVFKSAKLGLDNKYNMMASISQCELLPWIMLILLLSYLTCKPFLLLPEQRTDEMLIWSVGILEEVPKPVNCDLSSESRGWRVFASSLLED